MKHLALALLLLAPKIAFAAAIAAISFTAGSFDNFANDTTGFRFTVGSLDISVSALGFYDQELDGLTDPHTVAIFDVPTRLQVASATIPSGVVGILEGGFRYIALTPVILQAGETYVINGYRPSAADGILFNVSNLTVAAYLSYDTQVAANGTAGLAYTNSPFPGAANGWFGPSFKAEAIPEPAASALLVLGAAFCCLRKGRGVHRLGTRLFACLFTTLSLSMAHVWGASIITRIPTDPSDSSNPASVTPWAINDAGVVAGETASGKVATYSEGTLHVAPSPAISFAALHINSSGQIASTTQTDRAFRFTGTPGAGGSAVLLPTLGGDGAVAGGINDQGDVIGVSYVTPGQFTIHAFKYVGTPGAGGRFTTWEPLCQAAPASRARSIMLARSPARRAYPTAPTPTMPYSIPARPEWTASCVTWELLVEAVTGLPSIQTAR